MSNNVDQKAEVRKQKRAERRRQVMKDRREGPPKICTLCEKPHYTRTHLCTICNKRFKQMKKLDAGISIVKLVTIQKDFPGENVWEVISEGRANPAVPLWNRRPEMMTYKREQRAEHRSEAYHRTFYNKEDQTNIPPFIFREMKRFPDRELVGISGERTNPYVYYICQRCGEEQAIKYAELERGHDCVATKSSGEAVVEAYLKKQGITFLTQRRTLRCINPRTSYVMPYDIEIRQARILIEVQGNQHYQYTPYFHGTEENFQYQQWKDRYKKRYAEHMGYQILYLDYPDIKSERYIARINETI